MNTKKTLLACAALGLVAVQGAQAVPTATGFFTEVKIGGTYNRFNEQFRPDGKKKDDQIEIVKEHKNAFFIGASVGYSREMNCGLYFAAEFYGIYNNAKVEDKDHVASNIPWKSGNDTVEGKVTYSNMEATPVASYGVNVRIGGRLVPNFIVFAQCGFEGTYWKVKESLYAYYDTPGAGASNIIYNTTNDEFEIPDSECLVKVKTSGGEEIKRNTFSVVPGIGFQYLFNNGLYVGAHAGVAIGLYREIESKNCCKSTTTWYEKGTNNKLGDDSADGVLGGKVYMGRNVAVRYGLSIGYKF